MRNRQRPAKLGFGSSGLGSDDGEDETGIPDQDQSKSTVQVQPSEKKLRKPSAAPRARTKKIDNILRPGEYSVTFLKQQEKELKRQKKELEVENKRLKKELDKQEEDYEAKFKTQKKELAKMQEAAFKRMEMLAFTADLDDEVQSQFHSLISRWKPWAKKYALEGNVEALTPTAKQSVVAAFTQHFLPLANREGMEAVLEGNISTSILLNAALARWLCIMPVRRPTFFLRNMRTSNPQLQGDVESIVRGLYKLGLKGIVLRALISILTIRSKRRQSPCLESAHHRDATS